MAALDHFVGIDMVHAQAVREDAANGRFSGAHKARQDDVSVGSYWARFGMFGGPGR